MNRARVMHISLIVTAVAAAVADIAQHGFRTEAVVAAVAALAANVQRAIKGA